MSVYWFEVVPQGKHRRTPAWLRMVGIGDDGRAFVPVAAVDADEPLVCEWAEAAGVAVQRLGRHAYAESEWVKKRTPDLAWLVDEVVATARALRSELRASGSGVL